jgi:phage-related protein
MGAGGTLGSIQGTIKIDYDGAGIAKANTDLDDLHTKGTRTGVTIDRVGTRLLAAGGIIAGGFALAARSAANFEQGLSNIKAVTGATVADMESVRQKALQLGKDTQFSATEAAQAMEELAKAGVSIPDIMNGAADATVALAAAGGIALPEAATIASNAMNQFNLKAQDMPKIADLISGAANASAIDVSEFGQSIQQAGAVAHLAGVSFNDTAVAIALLGNAGIKGSDAGTSLKTFLQNLIPQTNIAAGEFQRLGLFSIDASKAMQAFSKNGIKATGTSLEQLFPALQQLTEKLGGAKVGTDKNVTDAVKLGQQMGILKNEFFDASGNVKSFADVSQVLQNALKGMTKEQQLSTLQTLFGADAIRAAAILANNGAAGFNTMADAMGKVKAADVAKTKMDNLKGSFEQMKGSLETASIEIGSSLLPALRSIVNAVTGVVNWFANLSSTTQQIIIWVALGAATFLLLGGAVIKTVTFFKGLSEAVSLIKSLTIWAKVARTATLAWQAAQWLLNLAMDANPLGLIILAVVALVAIIAILWIKSAGFRNLIIGVWSAIWSFLKTIGAWFAGPFAGFFVDLWHRIVNAFNSIMGPVMAVFNFIKTGIIGVFQTVSAIIGFFAPLFQAVFGLVVSIVQLAWAIISAIIAVGVAIIKAIIVPWVQGIIVIWNFLWGAVVGAVKAVWAFIGPIIQTGIAVISSAISTAATFILNIWNFWWNSIKLTIQLVWGFIGPFIMGAIQVISGAISGAMTVISAVWSVVWNAIKTTVQTVWSLIQGIIRAAIATIVGIIDGIKAVVDKVRGFFNQLKDAASGGVGSLLTFVSSIPGKIVSSIGDMAGALFQKGKDVIQGLINGIKSMGGAIKDALIGLLPGPLKKFAGQLGLASPSKLFRKWGVWTIQGLINGVASMRDALSRTMSSVSSVATSSVVVSGNVNTSGSAGASGPSTRPSTPPPPPGGAVTTNINTTVNAPAPIVDPNQLATYTARKVMTVIQTNSVPATA